ncbi:MAG: PepSY-like domain-containing protein [Bacteroidetes bacterium]|nr:PepSY-like domain-containing protein [Bacteroidota bacterium]
MKKAIASLFIFSIVICVSISSFAQIRKIPAEVTEALKSKYPGASNVTWKDKLTVFSALFEMNNEKYEARFNSKGEWQSTEKEISENDLPANVKDGLDKSKYADWELKSVYTIDLPEDKIQYRVQVAKSGIQKKNLLFSNDGRLLKDNLTL